MFLILLPIWWFGIYHSALLPQDGIERIALTTALAVIGAGLNHLLYVKSDK